MNSWIDVAGWTLVHFLWQGALIGAGAMLMRRVLPPRSAQARYAALCVALVAMLAAPPITAFVLTRDVKGGRTLAPRLHEVKWSGLGTAPSAGVPSGGAPSGPRADGTPVTAHQDVGAIVSGADVDAYLPPFVVVAWMAGVFVLLVRLAGGWWRVRRLHRVSLDSPSSRWTDAAVRMAGALRLTRVLHVVDSVLVDTPTVVGWLRPVILLPIAACANLTPAQVDAILAHELAHIRRHDILVNLVQTWAETVLFYHPAVWWVSARIREEREHCCDMVATSISGDVVAYAEALIELERWRITHTPLAVAATGGPLLSRVRRVLGAETDEGRRATGFMSLAVAAVCIAGIVGASQYLLAAQPVPSDGTPDAVVGGSVHDPAAWHMVFNHNDSQMRFIGFRGRDLIRFAYQIPEAQIIGGPRWMDEEILHLVVSLDAPPRADEMPAIVRRALEDRLQLQTHVEQRNFPVLALERVGPSAALSPRIRVSTTACFDMQEWIGAGQPPRVLPPAAPRQPVCGERPIGRTQYVAISMPQFAEELRSLVRGWPMGMRARSAEPRIGPTLVEIGNPDVVDRTGLTGRYDVDFSPFYPAAALLTRYPFLNSLFEPLGFSSVPRALEDQLGLTLVESRAPFDVIVIDSAQRP
jgi:uncharacterized protein (TIGR03435 family)